MSGANKAPGPSGKGQLIVENKGARGQDKQGCGQGHSAVESRGRAFWARSKCRSTEAGVSSTEGLVAEGQREGGCTGARSRQARPVDSPQGLGYAAEGAGKGVMPSRGEAELQAHVCAHAHQ